MLDPEAQGERVKVRRGGRDYCSAALRPAARLGSGEVGGCDGDESRDERGKHVRVSPQRYTLEQQTQLRRDQCPGVAGGFRSPDGVRMGPVVVPVVAGVGLGALPARCGLGIGGPGRGRRRAQHGAQRLGELERCHRVQDAMSGRARAPRSGHVRRRCRPGTVRVGAGHERNQYREEAVLVHARRIQFSPGHLTGFS
eukprot:scaffold29934_cov103-Isochrysis_galbana.AAC.2